MIDKVDIRSFIHKLCWTISWASDLDINNEKLYKIHIVKRANLLELRNKIDDILEKCNEDGY